MWPGKDHGWSQAHSRAPLGCAGAATTPWSCSCESRQLGATPRYSLPSRLCGRRKRERSRYEYGREEKVDGVERRRDGRTRRGGDPQRLAAGRELDERARGKEVAQEHADSVVKRKRNGAVTASCAACVSWIRIAGDDLLCCLCWASWLAVPAWVKERGRRRAWSCCLRRWEGWVAVVALGLMNRRDRRSR